MAYILPFLPYIAAAVSGAAAVRQGMVSNNTAQTNAELMQQRAEGVYRQTTAQEEMQRSGAREVIGNQLALGAESGTQLGGSRVDLLNQSLYNAELDALNIRYNGDLNAQGLNQQADFTRTAGKDAEISGYIGSVSAAVDGYGAAKKLAGPASGYVMGGNTIPVPSIG